MMECNVKSIKLTSVCIIGAGSDMIMMVGTVGNTTGGSMYTARYCCSSVPLYY
jgi:hypothetical protein